MADSDDVRQPLLGGADERGTSPSTADPPSEQTSFTRNLGTVEAFGIIISIVIGSGIFTSPGSIDSNVPSPGMALVLWLVGGLLAWTGATTLAELGTAIPGEGGVQPYLQYIFGDAFGFLAAWTWVVAVMPATLAILSIVFIESIFSAAGVTDQADRIEHKLLSMLTLAVVSAANCVSTRASTRLNNVFVATKFVAITAIVIVGIVVAIIQATNPERDDVGGGDWFRRPWFGYRNSIASDGSEIDWSELTGWNILGYYSTALYGALWAYSGWDKAIYVSAELSSPARQLPLAISTALPSIIVSFIAANAAYYILLPWDVIPTTDSVAVTAITRLLGYASGILAAVVICLVVAGSLLGNSFVAGRMAVAASHKGWFPRVFGLLGHVGTVSIRRGRQDPADPADPPDDAVDEGSPDSSSSSPSPPLPKPAAAAGPDAPINAIILSALLSALYILLGNFRALLTFNGLGEYSFFFLSVLGAIVLRFREPSLHRPYKPIIAIPVVFAVVSGFVVVRGALFAPDQAVILVVLWAVGLLFYLAKRKWAARRRA